MTHAMVTVTAPLPRENLAAATALIDALGNPARPDLAAALAPPDAEQATHFTSLHAIPSPDGEHAWLALELSADGTEEAALERVAKALGNELIAVFGLASDWSDQREILPYLIAHRVPVGSGWFDKPGIAFAGTPGLSVGRIRREAALTLRLTAALGTQPGGMSGRARLAQARAAVHGDPDLAWALEPAAPTPAFVAPGIGSLIPGIVGSFVAKFLWPVGLLLLVVALVVGLRFGPHWDWTPGVGPFLAGAVRALFWGTLIAIGLLLAAALVVYTRLRAAERTDPVDERMPPLSQVAEALARENRAAQNHMLSVTRRKPGWVRFFTLRLVFWIIGEFVTKLYRPGFLGDLGTIHFARWVTVPGSRDLLFFSNYGGSWESYLEDFITKAHAGLTAVWSNSLGFPRTENLAQKGATDGERFKRYARHSMIPTRFWFCAYPRLTTSHIRANAAIRLGFANAATEDEANAWLALFGSASRPPEKLVSSEIQSLIFGGLGFLPHGVLLPYRLPTQADAARRWLAGVLPHVAFSDGRRLRAPAVVTLALSAGGFARLGLPEAALETFPAAFLDGMDAPGRVQILGDFGPNAPEHWGWGHAPADVALLLYGRAPADVAALRTELDGLAASCGATLQKAIPMRPITEDKTEPFGFVDGISQPVIRGTYKGLRNADPIHLVEAGEFILGYPDNRGSRPPGPTLPAAADPANRLPLVPMPADAATPPAALPRDLGMNGSFLVIRQLEQDVAGFHAYCAAEAERLRDRLAPPYRVDAEYIGANLVGRWQDGSSLVRHPYLPRTEERDGGHAQARPLPATTTATPIERPQRPTVRVDNDFLFGTEDPEALRCPFGAHVRRANPRDSLDPGSAEQLSITNRHRILRVGRLYEPEAGADPGLLFMCLNADLERQFEFVQQTWMMSPAFHGLSCEKDPVMGDAEEGQCGFTIPTRDGPVRLAPIPSFVTLRGGGYFFLPGKQLIGFLAGT